MMTMRIDGLKELQNALKELPKEIQKRPLRSAVSAGAKVIADEAIKKAPQGETGNLRKSIYRYRSRRQSTTGKETFLVGVRKGKAKFVDNSRNRRLGRVGKTYQTQGEAYYWRFVEFGTSSQPARPFLRPAFENSKERAVQVMKERLGKAIETQARKLARK
jgi:HK97 gp10 family phage protein